MLEQQVCKWFWRIGKTSVSSWMFGLLERTETRSELLRLKTLWSETKGVKCAWPCDRIAGVPESSENLFLGISLGIASNPGVWMLATKPWRKLAVDYLEQENQADQMTRDDNVLLNDVYFNAYNMNHQPLTPLTPISKIVSDPGAYA